MRRKGLVRLLLGFLGIIACAGASLVFGFHNATHAAVWAMVAAIYATLFTSIIFQVIYRKNSTAPLINDNDDEDGLSDHMDATWDRTALRKTRRKYPKFFMVIFVIGILGTIAGLAGFGFYVTRALLDEEGIAIKSDWVVIVWNFMTLKWAAAVAWQVRPTDKHC